MWKQSIVLKIIVSWKKPNCAFLDNIDYVFQHGPNILDPYFDVILLSIVINGNSFLNAEP